MMVGKILIAIFLLTTFGCYFLWGWDIWVDRNGINSIYSKAFYMSVILLIFSFIYTCIKYFNM